MTSMTTNPTRRDDAILEVGGAPVLLERASIPLQGLRGFKRIELNITGRN